MPTYTVLKQIMQFLISSISESLRFFILSIGIAVANLFFPSMTIISVKIMKVLAQTRDYQL